MKVDWFTTDWEVRSYTDEQWRAANRWENKSPAQQAGETDEAWDRWIMASCVERNHGHQWWLDWDAEDGLWLHCRYCCAGVDELYPDGHDLIFGSLPVVAHHEPLQIDCGMVSLDSPVTGWHGPVRAWVGETCHRGGPWGPTEWDAWVNVEAV